VEFRIVSLISVFKVAKYDATTGLKRLRRRRRLFERLSEGGDGDNYDNGNSYELDGYYDDDGVWFEDDGSSDSRRRMLEVSSEDLLGYEAEVESGGNGVF
jgi:hypothetical protein